MEAQFRGKAQAYGPVVTDSKAAGKRSLDWDLNDWKWDGDLFVASSLNPISAVRTETPLINAAAFHGPSLYGGGTNNSQENGKNGSEGRFVVMGGDEANEDVIALNLKLGGKSYPLLDDEEGRSGKKTKVAGNTNTPACQVENCGADLTHAKDYHRRHKVCELHSKATQVVVGNVMQRFCQQCSRFHVLQEFDDGKRSCRRRLAGHNRRRRKTHPETAENAQSLNGEKLSSYLLISLLRVLANLQSDESNKSQDQDLLSRLLKNLQGQANGTSIPRLAPDLHEAQGAPNLGSPSVSPEKDSSRNYQYCGTVQSNEAQQELSTQNPPSKMLQKKSEFQGRVSATCPRDPARLNVQEETLERQMLNNIDLNSVYSQHFLNDQEMPHTSVDVPFLVQKHSQKLSPPQASRNSGSTSTHSPSSSSGSDFLNRTDRIIFKLFGKDPGDLPHLLRTQLLEWLSQSPTDIEGYIRPGCIVLTIYLRLNKTSWEELCCRLSSSLSRLLDMPNNSFWRTGWICTRVQRSLTFVCDGHVVLETQLPLGSYENCQITSVSPIAVPASEAVQFLVRGFNLSQSMSRLLCVLDGKYLVEENSSDLLGDADTLFEDDSIQCLSFSCSIPDVAGRGFIEIEEDSGVSGAFFPFIVADPDVCSEICTLERIIESAETCEDLEGEGSVDMELRVKALEFIQEMGWLLHRSSSNLRLHHLEGFGKCFPFERFKWLLDFSMDHVWPAVLKKLLDLFFNGFVETEAYSRPETVLLEMGLLHQAVRKNSRCLVESLLSYVPEKQTDNFFRADSVGPGGLTPLHIAAAASGVSEHVWDALLEKTGIEAWNSVGDSTGLTPNDYATLRGHYSYIKLVQQKKKANEGHVAVEIPAHSHTMKPGVSFRTEKLSDWQCNVCERKKMWYGNYAAGPAFAYRPATLSLLAVAAVCVCVALLFKTLPVVYLSKPFRWESLKYGAI